jgi:Spy/CpxP family protein refolding chaperone
MKFFLSLVFVLGFVFADSQHHYNKDLTYLNLSSIQKKQIVKILKNYRKEMKKYSKEKESLVKLKEKFFMLDSFDKMKIIKKNNDVSSKATKIEVNFLKNIHDILSKKQRKKFAKYMEDWDAE